ncbi:MAG: hypothetical protein ACYS1A_17565 [Planctomycetota bacterium]|jgi:hypothetical protein
MQEYEALVKLEDNVNPDLPPEKQGALWKGNEIIVVRPKGWSWGRKEVKHFVIVPLGFLTEEEAAALEEDVKIDYEEEDDKGEMQPQIEFVQRRRHRIDVGALLDKLPLTEEEKQKERDDIFNMEVEAQPFKEITVEASDIEDVTLDPAVQQKITERQEALVAEGKTLK